MDLFATSAPIVVVDLGANIGLFSLACLRLFPECDFIIHAIEPVTSSFEALEINLRSYKYVWIHVVVRVIKLPHVKLHDVG